jgi:hypothetical protein
MAVTSFAEPTQLPPPPYSFWSWSCRPLHLSTLAMIMIVLHWQLQVCTDDLYAEQLIAN